MEKRDLDGRQETKIWWNSAPGPVTSTSSYPMDRPNENCLAMYVHAGGLRNVWFGTAERGCDDNIITTWNPDPSTSDFAMNPVTFLCEKIEGTPKM